MLDQYDPTPRNADLATDWLEALGGDEPQERRPITISDEVLTAAVLGVILLVLCLLAWFVRTVAKTVFGL